MAGNLNVPPIFFFVKLQGWLNRVQFLSALLFLSYFRYLKKNRYFQMMQNNLRGELTNGKAPDIQEFDLVDAVARSLHLSTPKELEQLGAVLFPAMVNAAVVTGDIGKIDNLKSYGADLSAVNYDLRTALHIACSEGSAMVVKHLLLNGAAVHIRDRYDRTPLTEAITNDYHEIIKLLMKCGAHITGSTRRVGEGLCGAAARGLIRRLESYRLAGADLSQTVI
jgi:lysophospholipase